MDNRFLPASKATLHCEFLCANINLKRVEKVAKERNPTKIARFLRCVSEYPANYLVSVDEVSKDDYTYMRIFGRSPRGERCEAVGSFVRKRRFSMLAAMVLDEGIIASQVVEGFFTKDLFMNFLRNDLVSIYNL